MAPPLLSIKKHRVDDQTDAENNTRDPGHVDKADNNSFVGMPCATVRTAMISCLMMRIRKRSVIGEFTDRT